MIDPTRPFLIAMDVDGTQLREDVPKARYSQQDLGEIHSLKDALTQLRENPNAILLHATNRMMRYAVEDHPSLLVTPHYLSCDASTTLTAYDARSGLFQPSPDYSRVVNSVAFSADASRQLGAMYPELAMTGPEHQTDRKASFVFQGNVPLKRRREIQSELQRNSSRNTLVFMVETPEGHIVDFLPDICTKALPVSFVATLHKVDPSQVIVAGNSNNDIPMAKPEYNCIAVGNASASLKEHVSSLKGGGEHFISQRSNALGVLEGLERLGVFSQPSLTLTDASRMELDSHRL